MITSQKKVIELFQQGFKLERAEQFRRTFFYMTNRKDKEITVSLSIIKKMKESGVISTNDDYIPNLP
jgi:hypothetical protein